MFFLTGGHHLPALCLRSIPRICQLVAGLPLHLVQALGCPLTQLGLVILDVAGVDLVADGHLLQELLKIFVELLVFFGLLRLRANVQSGNGLAFVGRELLHNQVEQHFAGVHASFWVDAHALRHMLPLPQGELVAAPKRSKQKRFPLACDGGGNEVPFTLGYVN